MIDITASYPPFFSPCREATNGAIQRVLVPITRTEPSTSSKCVLLVIFRAHVFPSVCVSKPPRKNKNKTQVKTRQDKTKQGQGQQKKKRSETRSEIKHAIYLQINPVLNNGPHKQNEPFHRRFHPNEQQGASSKALQYRIQNRDPPINIRDTSNNSVPPSQVSPTRIR